MTVTRVEVFDTEGRLFVGYFPDGVDLGWQDDDRTLKVFARGPRAHTAAWLAHVRAQPDYDPTWLTGGASSEPPTP